MSKPMFKYRHVDCGGDCTKEPVRTSKAGLYTGLHGFTCTKCGKRGVKVTRVKS